jgi:hypothetical protein
MKLNAMKTNTTYLMVLLVFLLTKGFGKESTRCMLSNDPSPGEINTRFKLVRSDDKVFIYSRWIMVNKTKSARQLKARFIVDCPVENVIAVLKDETSYTTWMKAAKTCYRIKTVNASQWYSYVQFSIPWPLNDQDCILKYEVRKCEESGAVITLVSEPDLLRSYKGIERISHMEGAWFITQVGPGKTCVEYFICSMQEPKYPGWITAPLIDKNLLNTMKAFRDIIINSSK